MAHKIYREIPYNYTSAEDKRIVELLFSEDIWQRLDNLRSVRKSGRSARLLLRIIGELFIYFRNPYLFTHLCRSKSRRHHFFAQTDHDLGIIRRFAQGNGDVIAVIAAVEENLQQLKTDIRKSRHQNEKLVRALGGVIGKENVSMNPMAIISHITDATDWRLYAPVGIARPSLCDQMPALVRTIVQQGYQIIARGAGTGLTGGAVPADSKCIVINTERLNRIYPIENRTLDTPEGSVACKVVRVEAGAITENVMKHAAAEKLVFASDPTSAWASTIGGNISENAGGKSAVKWGTTIDNVLSFNIVTPNGETLLVERIAHPLRKIVPGDTVTFQITNRDRQVVKQISLQSDEVRKPGLWKDITNKALGGVPGIQKEGTDGIITEAVFVLYDAYPIRKTFCLEFFGDNFNEASRVIEQITTAFSLEDDAALVALEHFDGEYIKAIQYKVKSNVSHSPKAVLLIDMAAHHETDLELGEKKITTIISRSASTEVHVAQSPKEAAAFWHDRHQLGAIAKRTNAFKLNEDIVLPLKSLAPFTDWVERINLREERFVQNKAINQLLAQLQRVQQRAGTVDISEKIPALLNRCTSAAAALADVADTQLPLRTAMSMLRKNIQDILSGYDKWQNTFFAILDDTLNTVLVMATHMHAGDGNVHVNIPVFSNDAEMMERAELLVDELMAQTIELGGVVSGEHGIGITKIKYLDDDIITSLNHHRAQYDPQRVMNPGKLDSKTILQRVFTPSFNLLELEARILKRGKLEELANHIAHCVRCGKCKGDCCVFHPQQNLYFHPRNKNLAIGALIEAILFDAQRNRDTEFELLRELEEIADHCTICHKCAKPCPVDIDTGEISILERNLLEERGIKHSASATKLTLRYLSSTSGAFNSLVHGSVLFMGSRMQALATALTKPLRKIKPLAQTYPLQLLDAPMLPAPMKTLRDVLPACGPNQVLVFEGDESSETTVFYFPGCGSERMTADISLAALFLLLNAGHRVILPPPFLCCGFPISVNAKREFHNRLVLRDTIILSQIREMFSYLDFAAVAITCGTCKEALEQMGIGAIFKAPIQDVMAIMDIQVANAAGSVLYHRPCHDSLEDAGPEIIERMGCSVSTIPHCCAEAGTLALSRPDISAAMRAKKRAAIESVLSQTGARSILTNCPSCVQGLGKQRSLGIQATHMTVYAAMQVGGKDWKKQLLARLKQYERVTV
ncbi:MAG: DUF3683 domain-containing protein [Deltaproteobacteria bacterium]|nr:DUF3683 domain-containing protein [Deltaproteobacteria bacterium]